MSIGRATRTLILLLGVFLLGMASKVTFATVPFLLLALDFWPLGRLRSARDLPALCREKIPLLLMAAGCAA